MNAPLVHAAPRGIPLRRVLYEGFGWDDTGARCQGFDSVSMAVTLDFGTGGPYTFRWRVREPFECLTTTARLADDPTPITRITDVSQRWSHLLGACVIAQHVSMQETQWGLQPWSSRLDFDNGCRLVVCLGEPSPEGVPTYLPDALLVTDSESSAGAYRPRAALTSAWTDP